MAIPEKDIIIERLTDFIPQEKLRKMRSLDEVHEYLPVQAGGLKISSYAGPNADTLRLRTNVVRFVSNTPAMGGIAKRYSPFAIWRLFKDRFNVAPKDEGYFEELQEWEGISKTGEVKQTGRGHTNAMHLLDQMIVMGPTGDSFKRGPEPVPWHIHEIAVKKVIDSLHAAGVNQLSMAHMVLCTEDSEGDGIPFAMLKDKSAAAPYIFDPTRKPRKGNWLLDAVRKARRLLVKNHRGLLMWPGIVFKRYDRPAPIAMFADTEEARSDLVLGAKDRVIVAQPFPHQISEGAVFRPIQRKIQLSPVDEIDVRTQYHTSLVFGNMTNWVTAEGSRDTRFTIGVDESGWDHHMTPQGWYAAFQIARALYPKSQRVGWIECDEFIVFDRNVQRQLEEIAPGNTKQLTVRTRKSKADGTVIEGICVAKAGMEEIDVDSYLRRVIATASGNDILVGDIQLSGYKHVIDTPNDGKVQTGHGMRSGNWSTFLNNSLINWYKSYVYQALVADPAARTQFSEEFGYDLPTKLAIPLKLFRGDDAALCVETDRAFASGPVPISTLFADLIRYTGGKANAKKQETSDTPGRSMFGFAQMFVHEQAPTGVSGITRVMERMIYREEDEATGIDPATGEDLRHLIGDMGNWARLLTLYDAFGKTPHPLKDIVIGIWQDLDVPHKGDDRRMLPPFDPVERKQLSALFFSRLVRRGQAPSGSENLVNIWSTELGPDLETRSTENTKLAGDWNPIQSKPPEDARPEWRPRIN